MRERNATDNQLHGLLQIVNKTILPQSDWLAGVDTGELLDRDPQAVASGIDSREAIVEEITLSNRRSIEAALPDVIHTEDINRPYYHLQRAGYALMYSLTTWSLIFGCIGFPQCGGHGGNASGELHQNNRRGLRNCGNWSRNRGRNLRRLARDA